MAKHVRDKIMQKKNQFKPSKKFKSKYPVPKDELHWSARPFELEMHAETAEAIVSLTADSLHRSLFATLRHSVNQSVVIGAGRALTQSLASTLTNTLTFSLAQMLSRTLPMGISKEAVAALIPAATETIVPGLAASLTHQPQSDYYCWYCDKHKVFCEACAAARERQHRRSYWATYHAE